MTAATSPKVFCSTLPFVVSHSILTAGFFLYAVLLVGVGVPQPVVFSTTVLSALLLLVYPTWLSFFMWHLFFFFSSEKLLSPPDVGRLNETTM